MKLSKELVIAIACGAGRPLVEEIRDVHFEDGEDLEEGLETDLVLAIFHAAQIRLLDADPVRQVGLREGAILAE